MLMFSDLQITPAQVYPLQQITVTVLASNSAAAAVTADVHLSGWWVLTKSVTVPGGGTKLVTFVFYPSATGSPGVHSIIVEGLTGSVEVLALPATFVFSNLKVSPAQVHQGELITVTVDVRNSSNVSGSVDVHLTGWWVLTQSVYLKAGGSTTAVFSFRPSLTATTGVKAINVEGLTGSVTVLPASDFPPPPPPIGTIRVKTNIVGAPILIDGQAVGSTGEDLSLVTLFDAGQHIVSFGYVEGYTAPGSQTVTVVAEGEVTVTGIYQAEGAPPTPTSRLLWIAGGLILAAMVVEGKR